MNVRQTFSPAEVEASEWIVAMHGEAVSAEERARFEEWLRADPVHASIYEVQNKAWSVIGGMSHLLDESVATPAAARPQRFKAGRVAFFTAAAGILIAVSTFFIADRMAPRHHFQTHSAQIKDIRLDDGTLVTLGALSGFEVKFTAKERRVVLTGGEAFFEVTRDTSRPFFVEVGNTLVRVVGTKFDVRYGEESVRVAVMEGRVEVLKPQITDATAVTLRVLNAGEAVVAPKARDLAPIQSVDRENLGAWRSGRLVYVDTRLGEVVADINRYYDGRIALAAPSLGDLELTAAFRADQIEPMLQILTSALPVEVTRTVDARIILSARRERIRSD